MAGPGGKEVGRLSIRVLPDTTRFRGELQRFIKKIESSVVLNLTVKANVHDAQVALDKFRAEQSKKGVDFKVGVQTSVAKAQLAVLARNRTVALSVRINKASFAKAKLALASLSGSRLLSSILKDINEALGKIDLNLPKISRLTLGISALSSIVLTSSAGLVTLAGDLAKVGNTAFVLPAAFAGLATGILTLALALKDSKKQLAELGPDLRKLQDSISAKFWEQAKAPIIDLFKSVLPQLRSGFANTASALGRQAAAISAAFKASLGGGVLTAMFDRLVETMDIVTTGAGSFASALTTIGTVGSNYLPQLAKWIVKITDQFNTWIQKIAASGELDSFIKDGIKQMQLLGSSIANIVRILKGIDKAATAAGAGGLSTFAAKMKGAAEAVNSPAFQSALTTILLGANTAISGLGVGVKKIGSMLAELAPNISGALGAAGTALGGLIGSIADAMKQPEFKDGFTNFVAGISAGVTALQPAMAPLLALIGELGTAIGIAAASFGPLLATFKETLAPVLDSVIKAVTPLIPLFAGTLTGAIRLLSPLFQGLGQFIDSNRAAFTALFGALAVGVVAFKAYQATMAAVKGVQLGFAAASYGLAGATYAVTTAQKIGVVAAKAMAVAQKAGAAAQWLLNVAMDANPIGIIVIAIAALVAGLIWFFTQTKLGKEIWANFTKFLTDAWATIQKVAVTVFTAIGDFFSTIWNNIVSWVTTAIKTIQTIITTVVMVIVFLWQSYWALVIGVITTVWGAIVSFVTTAINNVVGVITAIVSFIVTVWTTYWNLVFSIIGAVWGAIVDFVTTAINNVVGVITAIVSFIVTMWTAYWKIVSDTVSGVWEGIVSFITTAINAVKAVIVAVATTIASVWKGIWAGVTKVVSDVWTNITGFVKKIIDSISGMLKSIGDTLGKIPGIVGDAFANAGKWLMDAGAKIIQGLIDGIMGMVKGAQKAAGNVMKAIANFFPHSPAKEGPFSGRGWTLYSGQAMGEGLADGMDSSIAKVRASALSMMSAATLTGRVNVNDASTTAANRPGVAGDSIVVQGNVGYDPAAIAAEIALKKRQAAMVNGIGRVLVA